MHRINFSLLINVTVTGVLTQGSWPTAIPQDSWPTPATRVQYGLWDACREYLMPHHW